MTGFLSWEARQVLHCPCAIHIHDNMEDCLPVYWQKDQEKGECLKCPRSAIRTWKCSLTNTLKCRYPDWADSFCGKQKTEVNPAWWYWWEPAPRHLWRKTTISSNRRQLSRNSQWYCWQSWELFYLPSSAHASTMWGYYILLLWL